MRYKAKVWQDSDGWWRGQLFEDPVNASLRWTGEVAVAQDRDEMLRELRAKRDYLELGKGEAEWLTLDDVPEPQSLKV